MPDPLLGAGRKVTEFACRLGILDYLERDPNYMNKARYAAWGRRIEAFKEADLALRKAIQENNASL